MKGQELSEYGPLNELVCDISKQQKIFLEGNANLLSEYLFRLCPTDPRVSVAYFGGNFFQDIHSTKYHDRFRQREYF